jgi:polysaccharide lyase-like protein
MPRKPQKCLVAFSGLIVAGLLACTGSAAAAPIDCTSAKPELHASTTSVRKGSKVQLTGSGCQGVNVGIQARGASAWKLVAHQQVASGGTFAVCTKPTSTQKVASFRAVASGTVSRVVRIKVKPTAPPSSCTSSDATSVIPNSGTTPTSVPASSPTAAPPAASPTTCIDPAQLTANMTLPACPLTASDTSSVVDPHAFWGSVDCQTESRQQQQTLGGDPHLSGIGSSQGDSAFRRMTVQDGDNFWGERCELGMNDVSGPTAFYRNAQRRVTFASIRLPANTDVNSNRWRTVLQMKQTQPYNNPDMSPVFELEQLNGQWAVQSSWKDLWYFPATAGRWTRFAFDIVYSPDPAIGQVKTYVDLNGDGDAADAGEQSPVIHVATLRTETAGPDRSAYAVGQAIPDHLRAGVYQDAAYPCPSGCSVDIDNVQVTAPSAVAAS